MILNGCGRKMSEMRVNLRLRFYKQKGYWSGHNDQGKDLRDPAYGPQVRIVNLLYTYKILDSLGSAGTISQTVKMNYGPLMVTVVPCTRPFTLNYPMCIGTYRNHQTTFCLHFLDTFQEQTLYYIYQRKLLNIIVQAIVGQNFHLGFFPCNT